MKRNDAARAIRDARYCLVLVVAMLLVWPAAAWSHAHPEQRTPAPDSTLQQAPAIVQIEYSEDLEAAFTTLEVVDANGDSVTKGHSHVASDNPRLLTVSLQPLKSGTYTVKWHVVARDGHTTEGSYQFQIQTR